MRWFTIILMLNSFGAYSQAPINLYMLPGMGTDHRVFVEYDFDTTAITPIQIKWVDYKPYKGFKEYAKALVEQIDTTQPFLLLGVSMGGMLAMEMSKLINPSGIILVSSAKHKDELPSAYRLGRAIPAYELLNENTLDYIAEWEKTFEDVTAEKDKVLYKEMLQATGADFLKWQTRAIVHWDFATTYNRIRVLHIHGDKDNILPLKNIKANHVIKGGTHKMVVNYRKAITELVNDYARNINTKG